MEDVKFSLLHKLICKVICKEYFHPIYVQEKGLKVTVKSHEAHVVCSSPALYSPGENILWPKCPDPLHESTRTGLRTGVHEGVIALFPIHVVAPVMEKTSQGLNRSECLDFRRLSHGWMINWVREQRLHPPLSAWWCRIMFWTQPDKTWWWLMRSRSYSLYCGWVANSNPFIISLFSLRMSLHLKYYSSFVNWSLWRVK